MRAAALVLACPLSVACAATSQFTVFTPDEADVASIGITVTDRTGMIRDVGLAVEPVNAPDGISVPPGRPNVLTLTWLGGLCDHGVDIEVTRRADGLLFTRTTRRADACRLAGISRSIDVTFADPVARASIQVVDDAVVVP